MIEDEGLWQEFAVESEEHLDAIERALTAGGTDRPTVDRLFRGFHSLKGMSDALGARGMKTLAHRAEDLLGQARNGRVLVTGSVADALAIPGTDLRLFGKPESFIKRRMGVALARAEDTGTARRHAKAASAAVKPTAA